MSRPGGAAEHRDAVAVPQIGNDGGVLGRDLVDSDGGPGAPATRRCIVALEVGVKAADGVGPEDEDGAVEGSAPPGPASGPGA